MPFSKPYARCLGAWLSDRKGRDVGDLTHHEKWKGVLGYNTHALKVVWLKPAPWDADDDNLPDLDLRSESCAIKVGTELKDEHGTRIATWLHRHEGVHLNKAQALEAAVIAAQHCRCLAFRPRQRFS